MLEPKAIKTVIKPWGSTMTVALGQDHEVMLASIKKGGYSSCHCHEQKWNDFFVIKGQLRIILYAKPICPETSTLAMMQGGIIRSYDLEEGQSVSVAPGQWHRFEAITEVELIETYYHGLVSPEDINRRDIGGCKS